MESFEEGKENLIKEIIEIKDEELGAKAVQLADRDDTIVEKSLIINQKSVIITELQAQVQLKDQELGSKVNKFLYQYNF